MSSKSHLDLPASFQRLAWSNLAAQSAEQIGLAAAPIVAVLALGAREGAVEILQTAQTLPFLLFSIPAESWWIGCRGRGSWRGPKHCVPLRCWPF